MYTTLVKNRICRDSSNSFCCILCEEKLIDKDNLMQHINGQNHVEQLKKVKALHNLKIDEIKSQEIVGNGIISLNIKEYKCNLCDCHIPGIDHVPEHIIGKKHVSRHKRILSVSDNSSFKDISVDEKITAEQYEKNEKTTAEQYEKNEKTTAEQYEKNEKNTAEQYEKNEKNTAEQYERNMLEPNINIKDDGESELCSRLPVDDVHKDQQNSSNNIGKIYCKGCQGNLENDASLQFHRMFHLSQTSCNINDVVRFSIKDNKKAIYCLICDYMMKSEEALSRHLKEISHQKRVIIVSCLNDMTIRNLIYWNPSLYLEVSYPLNANNIYVSNTEFYSCLINLEQHITNNIPVLHLPAHRDFVSVPIYWCFICRMKFVDERLLSLHYDYDNKHKYRMIAINLVLKDMYMKIVVLENDHLIHCSKCLTNMTDINGAVSHLFETQHTTDGQIQDRMSNNTVIVNNMNLSRNMYECPICKISVEYDYIMAQHLESDCHKNKVREYYANMNCLAFQKLIYFCAHCKDNFFNDKSLLDHFYNVHQNGVKNRSQTNNAMIMNSANMYHLPLGNSFLFNQKLQYYDAKVKNYKNVSQIEVDYTLDNLVNFNLSQRHQQNSVLRSTTKSNNINSQENFSISKRTRNLIISSPRYIKLCVESGEENIFKMHPMKMKRLELSISLTFPYQTNRCCIPCRYEISSDPQLIYEHLRTEEHERNLQEMEENDEFFENYRHQLSDLELAKSYMCDDSDEWVKCYACDYMVENCDSSLRNHMNSECHLKNYQNWKNSSDEIFILFKETFENLWYFIEKYYCNVCSAYFEFEVDYARHLESCPHIKQVEKKYLYNEQNFEFDCCILCSSFWYGKSDHYSAHCEKDSHKYILRSRDFTVPDMPELTRNILATVKETMNHLLMESDEMTQSRKETEKTLLECVEMVVKPEYPQAKAYLFGSRISSLSKQDSDLDIYLDCEDGYTKVKSNRECSEQISVLQEYFHKHQNTWVIEEIITRSRVPIIKLRHRPTNLNCDISLTNGLSVEKSKILGYFVDAYALCRKLILFLKKWCTLCRLSGAKSITTFAISWLVIFYLQVKQIFPSVQRLIELKNHSHIVGGWETGVSETITVGETDDSIEELLEGFFSYYAEFDYTSDVACPFLGKVMKKSQFSDIDHLPEELDAYKNQVKEEKIEFFRLDSPMCIQEPIDLSQNITKAVTKLHLRMFKQYCAESSKSLKTSSK